MKKSMVVVSMGLVLAMACATRVYIMPTHREDVNAQARVLAIASQNLEGATRGRTGVSGDQEHAAQDIAAFHTAAEEFARQAGMWHSDDDVDGSYERLIRAYVHMKQTYPDLRADALVADSHERVEHEWEKLARVTGYAGKKYQRSIEDKDR